MCQYSELLCVGAASKLEKSEYQGYDIWMLPYLCESKNVVDKKKHILSLSISEMFSNCQTCCTQNLSLVETMASIGTHPLNILQYSQTVPNSLRGIWMSIQDTYTVGFEIRKDQTYSYRFLYQNQKFIDNIQLLLCRTQTALALHQSHTCQSNTCTSTRGLIHLSIHQGALGITTLLPQFDDALYMTRCRINFAHNTMPIAHISKSEVQVAHASGVFFVIWNNET